MAGKSAESWAGACPGAEDCSDGRDGGASGGEGDSALLSYLLAGKRINHNGLDQALCVACTEQERSTTF